MLVIGSKFIFLFIQQHADSKSSLTACFEVLERANWKNIMEIKRTYPHADAVGTCTVFNVKGNKYRLIAKIDYPKQIVQIKRVLTHAEYDRQKWKKDCDG